ncbi:MAG: response regulator transcription factor [Clostridia bacterium]|nr:response regulator transcription factor [Clostridia bacterium]MCI9275016.1 response regulator transcription factor [Clostridia bacterium]
MKKILIVEDEASISDLIKIELEYKGYKCDVASDGELACEYIDNKDYDLALLDVMVPKIDGYELLEYIKITKELPVIFITAKSQTKDKIKGLREGADDYITKPFEMEELVARIEVVLRRYNKASNIINIDNVEIDVLARAVKLNSEKVDLTPKEFDLLMLLAQNIGSALYRETIFEKVWGEELEFETRTLDLHIQRLRKKLNWKDKIKTVYRIGYMLEK